MQIIKILLMSTILIYASVVDIKERIVPTHIHISLLVVGLIGFDLPAIYGMIMTFVPLFILYLFIDCLKGGDIKLCSMCSFVLQGLAGIEAALIGLFLGAILAPIINKVMHKPINSWLPAVPTIAIGYIITGILTI